MSLANQLIALREAHRRFTSLQSRREKFRLSLFNKQQELLNDPSPLKAVVCSRRAGKSHVLGGALIETAYLNPGVSCAYVALTRASAKRIIWRHLKNECRRLKINAKFNNSELTITLDNDSVIYIFGASDEDDIEKLRGDKYKLVVIDEAGSFKSHLAELVDEAIEPALIDLHGTLILAGTPNSSCAGFFFDVTTKKELGYSVHHWTLLDNPHIPHAKQWLENRMARKGWTKDHPVYLREWCGLWVRSDESRVYKFSREKNVYKGATPANLRFILGIDLGFEDKTAFVVVGYNEEHPHVFVPYTYARSKMLISDIETTTKNLIQEFGGFDSIVMDTGGLGKTVCEEIRKRTLLPIKAAEKTQKADNIELCNSDMCASKILVHEDQTDFMEEMELLQWDLDVKSKRVEDPRFENHKCDAFLYAYREARHYLFVPKKEGPKPGTDEYFKELEKEMEVKLVQEFEKKQSDNWWEEM